MSGSDGIVLAGFGAFFILSIILSLDNVRILYATFLCSAISNSFGLHSLIEKVPL